MWFYLIKEELHWNLYILKLDLWQCTTDYWSHTQMHSATVYKHYGSAIATLEMFQSFIPTWYFGNIGDQEKTSYQTIERIVHAPISLRSIGEWHACHLSK